MYILPQGFQKPTSRVIYCQISSTSTDLSNNVWLMAKYMNVGEHWHYENTACCLISIYSLLTTIIALMSLHVSFNFGRRNWFKHIIGIFLDFPPRLTSTPVIQWRHELLPVRHLQTCDCVLYVGSHIALRCQQGFKTILQIFHVSFIRKDRYMWI